jgi:hypothetical protein
MCTTLYKTFFLNGVSAISMESIVNAFNKSLIKVNQKELDEIFKVHKIHTSVNRPIDFE